MARERKVARTRTEEDEKCIIASLLPFGSALVGEAVESRDAGLSWRSESWHECDEL